VIDAGFAAQAASPSHGLGFHGLKAALRRTACRADPIVRKIFELSTCRDVAVGIAYRRVINVAANPAYIFHFRLLSCTVVPFSVNR
jgi:hypothetical protein